MRVRMAVAVVVVGADTDHDGYVRSNTHKPVACVRETRWPSFLKSTFGIPTG